MGKPGVDYCPDCLYSFNGVLDSYCNKPGCVEELVYRLRKRAEIRRSIATRKSVQEGKPDRIADLLEEAASRIYLLEEAIRKHRSATGEWCEVTTKCAEYLKSREKDVKGDADNAAGSSQQEG